jgi:hypothetical protein
MRTVLKATLIYTTETGRICPNYSQLVAQKEHRQGAGND